MLNFIGWQKYQSKNKQWSIMMDINMYWLWAFPMFQTMLKAVSFIIYLWNHPVTQTLPFSLFSRGKQKLRSITCPKSQRIGERIGVWSQDVGPQGPCMNSVVRQQWIGHWVSRKYMEKSKNALSTYYVPVTFQSAEYTVANKTETVLTFMVLKPGG